MKRALFTDIVNVVVLCATLQKTYSVDKETLYGLQ